MKNGVCLQQGNGKLEHAAFRGGMKNIYSMSRIDSVNHFLRRDV